MPIDAPIHTSTGNLPKVLNAGLPVLLVFWRRDCAPCDQLTPILNRLARSYAGRVLVVKINADEEPGLVSRYQVDALPSLVFVQNGRDLATARGAVAETDLVAWLEHLTGSGPRPPVPAGPSVPFVSTVAGHAAPQAAPAPGKAPEDGTGHPVVLTDANFDQVVRESKVPVLVDFWAVWCGPCRMVAPVVEQLAKEYAGRALVGKVNVDENQGVAGRYGIMSIPTLLIFRNGQVVDQIVGAQPAPVLRQRFARQIA